MSEKHDMRSPQTILRVDAHGISYHVDVRDVNVAVCLWSLELISSIRLNIISAVGNQHIKYETARVHLLATITPGLMAPGRGRNRDKLCTCQDQQTNGLQESTTLSQFSSRLEIQ
ncbi:hypothetical protein J3459_017225 [Metarhizium acridum]|nr:hypothetical protein J3459_017225 [Metarhizium acridum]